VTFPAGTSSPQTRADPRERHLRSTIFSLPSAMRHSSRKPGSSVTKGDRLMPVLERMRGLLQSEFIKLVLWELERAEVQSGPA
jgi:hypothetical protein